MNKLFTFGSWSILLLVFCFSSCKSAKETIVASNKATAVDDLISKIDDNAFRPSWFRAKAQLQYKAGGRGMSFTSTIISKDNEVLWLNGKKFGIEGARIMVTPDSVFALNRLQKEYLADDITWVAEEYELPALLGEAISLTHLQDIFIGNPIMDIIPYTQLTSKENEILLNGNREDYQSELMVNQNNLQARYFTFTQGESILTVKYSDYRLIDDKHAIAYKRNIVIQRPGEQELQLQVIYDNITINQAQDIKFNIPGSYKRM